VIADFAGSPGQEKFRSRDAIAALHPFPLVSCSHRSCVTKRSEEPSVSCGRANILASHPNALNHGCKITREQCCRVAIRYRRVVYAGAQNVGISFSRVAPAGRSVQSTNISLRCVLSLTGPVATRQDGGHENTTLSPNHFRLRVDRAGNCLRNHSALRSGRARRNMD